MGEGTWADNPIIELKNVSKLYQMGEVSVTALNHVSLAAGLAFLLACNSARSFHTLDTRSAMTSLR